MKLCTIEGCGRQHRAKGLCALHYYQRPEQKAKSAARQRETHTANMAALRMVREPDDPDTAKRKEYHRNYARQRYASQDRARSDRAYYRAYNQRRKASIAAAKATAAALAAVESYVLSLFPTDPTTQE